MKKSKLLPAVALAAAGVLSINQAHALGSNEAAILVGVAVGGLTTYALQQSAKSHHHHHHYQPAPPPRHHHHPPPHHHKPVHHAPPKHAHTARPFRAHPPAPKGHAVHGRDRGYEYVYEYRRGTF